MGEPMDSRIPRFNPVAVGSGAHHSADDDQTSGPSDSGDRSIHNRYSRMAAYAEYSIYRFRVAILSGLCFLGGSGFALYHSLK